MQHNAGVEDGWRKRLLLDLPGGLCELVLVQDVDGLLADDAVQGMLQARGYTCCLYDDALSFRAWYERHWRHRLEAAIEPGPAPSYEGLLVIWRRGGPDWKRLVPFDLLQQGRCLTLTTGGLFPRLAPLALRNLEIRHLDALWRACQVELKQSRGPDASKDFILERVFEVDCGAIVNARVPAARLLGLLLRLHGTEIRLPPPLLDRLGSRLSVLEHSLGWPLGEWLEDRASFLGMLQRVWEGWVQELLQLKPREEGLPTRMFEPVCLLEDREVMPWLQSCFSQGLLKPCEVPAEIPIPAHQAWIGVGILQDIRKDAAGRLRNLLQGLTIPSTLAGWQGLARNLAEGEALLFQSELPSEAAETLRLRAFGREADVAFGPFITQGFAGLMTLPWYNGPVMVHHVPRYMATRRATRLQASRDAGSDRDSGSNRDGKLALLVLDGLALDQWAVMRRALKPFPFPVQWEESATVAWIPTLTSVSRQAIFAGQPPRDFGGSIFETRREPALWQSFWEKEGLTPNQVSYLGLIRDQRVAEVLERAQDPSLQVLGGVLPLVDELIHGLPLERVDLLGVLNAWILKGVFQRLLEGLLSAGYEVFLTSDHGNVEATGCGALSDGMLADIRGVRARVYPTQGLRQTGAAQAEGSILWPGVGLPDDFVALLAPTGRAFLSGKERVSCHGGASLLEVMVPFVHLRRS